MKFTSDVSGQVTGIRFYKGTGNTGTHVGQPVDPVRDQAGHGDLHQRDRHRLAAGQLRHARCRSPPAPTYVASYLAPNGRYAADGGYFTTGMDRAPLHALRDGVSGGNGVYAYGTTSTFPDNTWNSTNYWVDVVFASGPVAPPTAPAHPRA